MQWTAVTPSEYIAGCPDKPCIFHRSPYRDTKFMLITRDVSQLSLSPEIVQAILSLLSLRLITEWLMSASRNQNANGCRRCQCLENYFLLFPCFLFLNPPGPEDPFFTSNFYKKLNGLWQPRRLLTSILQCVCVFFSFYFFIARHFVASLLYVLLSMPWRMRKGIKLETWINHQQDND